MFFVSLSGVPEVAIRFVFSPPILADSTFTFLLITSVKSKEMFALSDISLLLLPPLVLVATLFVEYYFSSSL